MEDVDHSDRAPKRRSLDLSVTQVAASSMAAVAGAVLASELGVYGTILGAAVVSAGATTGSALFQHVFRRTGEQLRDLASTPTGAVPVQRPPGRRRRMDLRGEPSAAGLTDTGPTPAGRPAAGSDAPFDPFDPGGERTRMMAAIAPPEAESVTTYRGRTTWKPRSRKSYALMAVLVFALAMGTVTAVELVAGKPVTAIVKDESGSGTSFGGSVHKSGGSGGTGPATHPSPATPPGGDPSGTGGTGGNSTGGTGGTSSGTPDPTPSGTPSGTPSSTPSSTPTSGGGQSPQPDPSGGAAAGQAATPSTAPTP